MHHLRAISEHDGRPAGKESQPPRVSGDMRWKTVCGRESTYWWKINVSNEVVRDSVTRVGER
jgi:hypothetical protein